jgi:glutamate 5-kinase
MLSMGLLPVVNENDSVCTDEIKVGDNDTLAAMVASMCRADLTVLLTTVDGMRERNVDSGELGARISVVRRIDKALMDMAGGTDGNSFSIGGMATKLHAAATTTACGEPLWIAEGMDFSVLRRIFAGEDVGTVFLSRDGQRMHARQRFIAFFAEPEGELIVDGGAVSAIRDKGKSLLPSGILGMRGVFAPGSVVCIVDAQRNEIGRGIVNFGTVELSKICGAGTEELPALLGRNPAATEAVHRDFLVVTRQTSC